jgi:fructan beta-fructosidase
LSLYTTDGVIKLKQEPIINSKVKTETLALTKNYVLNSSLGKKTQNSYRLILDIDLTSSKGFDLQLLKYENQYLLLSYDVSTKIFSVDRTKSGKVDFNKRFSSVETTKILPKNNKLLLDILVDKSIMEVYINGGKVVFTELTFPDNQSTSEVFSFF